MSVHGDQKHTTDDNCLITLEPIWSAGLPPLDSNDVGRDLTNTSNQLQLEEHLSVVSMRLHRVIIIMKLLDLLKS